MVENMELPSKAPAILIIDDDVSIGNMLTDALTTEGYAVLRAYSGTEALLILEREHPDLILLDIAMPIMDGKETLKKIKSNPEWSNIPVIFLTSKDDRETVMKVLAAKPEKYLLKTRPAEELIKSVDDFFKGN